MTRRTLTDDDRARFAAAMTPAPLVREATFLLLFIVPAGFACGLIAALVLAVGIDLLTDTPRPQRTMIAKGVGWAAGAAFYALAAVTMLRTSFRDRNRRAAIGADLARGEVIEETAHIVRLIRLREEEHATELLLVETDDGRVRALLDDSTTNTEGRPRRSTLKLARDLRVLRLPGSGFEVTIFEGAPLRRPPARDSDPRNWPETDQWLPPDSIARLAAG